MKSDKRNDHPPGDTVLARLLAEALESKAAGDAQSSACPDAEILAAYAENGLSAHEVSGWEGHIADCGRCQKIIAGIVVSAENLVDAELTERPSVVSPSAVWQSEPQPATLEISRRRTAWHWWVPGLGLAAAVALWFVLHPPVSNSPASPRAAATAGTSQSSAHTATSPAKPEETQVAGANVPPPLAGPSVGELRDSEKPRATSPADALKKNSKEQSLQSGAQGAPVLEADNRAGAEVENRTAAPAEAPAKDAELSAPQQRDEKTQNVEVFGAAPRVATPAPPPAAPPALQFSPRAGVAAPQGLDRSARQSINLQAQALAKSANAPVVFASPDGTVLWRVGAGGLIEHSSDRGENWSAQPSGVTADLLAGAAPSPKFAWAVGKVGIILRTEDGDHWHVVTPPSVAANVAPPDWIAVDARDELHATVISRDLHRYATADGGRTWVQEQ